MTIRIYVHIKEQWWSYLIWWLRVYVCRVSERQRDRGHTQKVEDKKPSSCRRQQH